MPHHSSRGREAEGAGGAYERVAGAPRLDIEEGVPIRAARHRAGRDLLADDLAK